MGTQGNGSVAENASSNPQHPSKKPDVDKCMTGNSEPQEMGTEGSWGFQSTSLAPDLGRSCLNKIN